MVVTQASVERSAPQVQVKVPAAVRRGGVLEDNHRRTKEVFDYFVWECFI